MITDLINLFRKPQRNQRKEKPKPKVAATIQATDKPDTYNEWITSLQFQTK
jgi:hypothetical protein